MSSVISSRIPNHIALDSRGVYRKERQDLCIRYGLHNALHSRSDEATDSSADGAKNHQRGQRGLLLVSHGPQGDSITRRGEKQLTVSRRYLLVVPMLDLLAAGYHSQRCSLQQGQVQGACCGKVEGSAGSCIVIFPPAFFQKPNIAVMMPELPPTMECCHRRYRVATDDAVLHIVRYSVPKSPSLPPPFLPTWPSQLMVRSPGL